MKTQGAILFKMENFSYFPSHFFHVFGEFLVLNGSRAVPKEAWRCCKTFGTSLGSVFFDFPPLRWHFFVKNQDAILVKMDISVSSCSFFFHVFGQYLVSNGSRAVPKGIWWCSKSFGTILGSVIFHFPPLK